MLRSITASLALLNTVAFFGLVALPTQAVAGVGDMVVVETAKSPLSGLSITNDFGVYPCPLFGADCSKNFGWQPNLNYNFGNAGLGGALKANVWAAVSAGGELGDELFPQIGNFWQIGNTSASLQIGVDIFNLHNEFASSKNVMFTLDGGLAHQLNLGKFLWMDWNVTPGVAWKQLFGMRDCYFEDYGSFRFYASLTAHPTDALSISVTPGKVLVYQGHYNEPQQFLADVNYTIDEHWSAHANYAYANSGSHRVDKTSGWTAGFTYAF